jgi:hypothetical protein
MPPFDYTDAPKPREIELIPDGTTATLSLHIRPGGEGEDRMLKSTQRMDAKMLDLELTVMDGKYKGRKLWSYQILEGTTEGHAQAIDIARRRLKEIIDSARGLKPDDTSPEARAARTVSLREFEGMTFMGKIGIEKGKLKNAGTGEFWPDKNILLGAITPDKNEWRPSEQPPPFPLDGGDAMPLIERPSWAD